MPQDRELFLQRAVEMFYTERTLLSSEIIKVRGLGLVVVEKGG